MLDLRDATAFVRLCETGNLTRTAELCAVSPSSLSRCLNRLEQELGCQLCERGPHGVSITPKGRRFETFARRTLQEYATLSTTLQARGTLEGSVSIFCSVTASYLFIPRILNELQLSQPGLEVHLVTGDPADALTHLHQREADLVISALPHQPDPRLKSVPLTSFPLILIAPRQPRFGGGHGEALHDYDLSEVPFVLARRGQLRLEVDRWLASQGIKPHIYSEVSGHEAIVALAALGFGVAVVPRLVFDISPFRSDLHVLSPLPPEASFRVALCHLQSRSQEPVLTAVHELTSRISGSFNAAPLRHRIDGML